MPYTYIRHIYSSGSLTKHIHADFHTCLQTPVFFQMEFSSLVQSIENGKFHFDLVIVAVGSLVAFLYTVVGLAMIKLTGAHYAAVRSIVKHCTSIRKLT